MIKSLAVIAATFVVAALGIPSVAFAEASTNMPTGIITGVVTDETTGLPLANYCGLTINLRYANDTYLAGNSLESSPHDVRTFTGCLDADGDYTIIGVPSDSYDIYVTDSGGTFYNQWFAGTTTPYGQRFSAAESFDATNGQSTTEDLDLTEAASISGTLTNALTGKPIADDCSQHLVAQETSAETQAIYRGGCTDSKGNFTISGVQPGEYSVGVNDGGGYLGDSVDVTTTGGQQSSAPALALTPAAVVKVIFRAAAKGHRRLAHAADVSANLYSLKEANDVGGYRRRAPTNRFGAVVIRNGEPGTYQLEVRVFGLYRGLHWGGGGSPAARPRVTLTAGQHLTVTAYLKSSEPRSYPPPAPPKPKPKPAAGDPASVSGTVTDASTGDPLAGYCGLDISVLKTTTAARVATWRGCLDSEGNFAINDVPTLESGTEQYTLHVTDSGTGYAPSYLGNSVDIQDATKFAVTSGSAVAGQDVALEPDGTISGTLYDLDGDPIVSTCGITIVVGNVTQTNACTDAAGGYSVPGIYPGTVYAETITVPNFYPHTPAASFFELQAGEVATGIDAYPIAKS